MRLLGTSKCLQRLEVEFAAGLLGEMEHSLLMGASIRALCAADNNDKTQ